MLLSLRPHCTIPAAKLLLGIPCANSAWRLGALIPFSQLGAESTGPPHGQLKSRRVLRYECPRKIMESPHSA